MLFVQYVLLRHLYVTAVFCLSAEVRIPVFSNGTLSAPASIQTAQLCPGRQTRLLFSLPCSQCNP